MPRYNPDFLSSLQIFFFFFPLCKTISVQEPTDNPASEKKNMTSFNSSKSWFELYLTFANGKFQNINSSKKQLLNSGLPYKYICIYQVYPVSRFICLVLSFEARTTIFLGTLSCNLVIRSISDVHLSNLSHFSTCNLCIHRIILQICKIILRSVLFCKFTK